MDLLQSLNYLAENPCKARLYSIKGRSEEKPVAICFGSHDQLMDYLPSAPADLIHTLLPGPVTLVLPREASIPDHVNPNTTTVACRIPAHNLTRSLCTELGPLCLTSANKSGFRSAITTNDFADLKPHLDCIVDQGTIKDNALSR